MKKKIFAFAVLALLSVSTVSAQGLMMATRSKTDPVKIGETAPDFALTDENGRAVKLSDLKQTTVLVFYRAYWCPFCVRQLAELRSLKQAGDKFVMFGISPDPTERAKETRMKIARDGKGELSFPLLSDTGSKTINDYGVYDPTYADQGIDGIPRPAIFIIDKNRKVIWAKVELDYKKRPTNADLRAELEKLQ